MAGEVVRELITVWGFDVKDAPLKKLDKSIDVIKTSLKVATGLTVGLGASLFGIAKTVANVGDEAMKSSRALGVNVESLQELRYAADLAGVSKEDLNVSLQRLSRNAYEAATGNKELGKTFSALGVRVTDSNGNIKDAGDIVEEIAAGFQKMPDGAKKTALAMEIFGKSGAKMINLLNEGPEGIAKFRQEARDLGVVIGEDAAKAAEEFNDSISRLKAVGQGLAQLIGIELFPVIKDLVDEMRAFFLANRAVIKQDISAFIRAAISIFRDMVGILRNVISFLQTLAKAFGGVSNMVEFLGKALAALVFVKLLFGLGQLSMALVAVALKFKAMGMAALIAQIKLLLIPIAIGAIIAALALLVEDIIAFAQGRDSVLGRAIGYLGQFFDFLSEKFSGLGTIGKILVSVLLTPVRAIVNAFKNLITLIDILRGKLDVLEGAKKIGKNIANTFGFGIKSLKGALGFGEEEKPGIAGAVQNIGTAAAQVTSGIGPQRVIQERAQADKSMQKQVSVNSNVDLDLNVTGMDAQAAQEMVTGTLRDELGGILRETVRDGEGQVER
jgi:hypothetical protein